MILADTSAWVAFLRGSGSLGHRRLVLALGRHEVAITEPIVMELLAGARSPAHAHRLRRMVAALEVLPLAGMADFEDAATIYRACRRAGVTPRSQIDCLVAAVAIRTDTPVLHEDRDYAALAGVVPLPLVDLSV